MEICIDSNLKSLESLGSKDHLQLVFFSNLWLLFNFLLSHLQGDFDQNIFRDGKVSIQAQFVSNSYWS